MRALLLLLALQSAATAQPDRYGLPACAGPNRELATRTSFTLCYDASTQTPLWTIYELTPASLEAPTTPRPKNFRRDPLLNLPSASDADYRNSGFSRGHMVPAADLASNPEALRESFYLSNAVPQNPALNSGKWRLLESHIRRLARHADSVIILTGPIFCDQSTRIGAHNVAVPCSLYKVVLASYNGQLTMYAAELPNTGNPAEPLTTFATAARRIEQSTGLDFFPQLPQSTQDALELHARPEFISPTAPATSLLP